MEAREPQYKRCPPFHTMSWGAEQAVKERAQYQSDAEYWKKNAADYKGLADKKEEARGLAATEAASEKARADTLNKQLILAQKQNADLTQKLTTLASPTPQASATPAPPHPQGR
jgi:hypothetical protein